MPVHVRFARLRNPWILQGLWIAFAQFSRMQYGSMPPQCICIPKFGRPPCVEASAKRYLASFVRVQSRMVDCIACVSGVCCAQSQVLDARLGNADRHGGAVSSASDEQPGGEPALDAGSKVVSEAEKAEEVRPRVVLAGISPPLQLPVLWLHAQLHAPDFFLYVVVHML
jgi:Autophagy protein Apg5